MISKKKLAITAFALLLSQQSFASEKPGFYMGGSSYGQFFNSTSQLKLTKPTTGINNLTINDRNAQKTKGQKLSEYKADYNPPFAASIKCGYAGEFKNHSYRAELEGMYSSVKVDNIGLANSQITLSYIKKEGSTDNLYAAVVDHDHIENKSLMVNAYHYWKNDRFSFSPYVGAGAGLTKMKMFEKASIRPAYQLKAGLDYRLSEDAHVHVGYRYFGAVGTDIKLTATELGKVESNGSGGTKLTSPASTAKTEKINIGNKLFGNVQQSVSNRIFNSTQFSICRERKYQAEK